MRRLVFMLTPAMFLLLISCSWFQKTYYTDFDSDDGKFSFNEADSETFDTGEIADGSLHLKSTVNDEYGSGAQAVFSEEIPVKSSVSFTVTFGSQFNTQHPRGHFNFFQTDPDSRMVFMAGPSTLSYFVSVDGETESYDIKDMVFNEDTAYEFEFKFKPMAIYIYVDESFVNVIDYPEGLPLSGDFIFECHNEYWVDNFGYEILE
ncbi:MAG: hypothetical protein PQJ61_11755 [Spirochaetales bacterium]|uniref:Lipoprotein n=1 Tax=Candidatus Thalassospirochaeta sargassi TaxID=3119039 RepID=A0AAJ1IDN5_9SPIO|nr:hypothetical protein [Spirochaetales bacterium]